MTPERYSMRDKQMSGAEHDQELHFILDPLENLNDEQNDKTTEGPSR